MDKCIENKPQVFIKDKSHVSKVYGMLQVIMYNYVNQNVEFMKKLNILSMLQQC